MIKVVSKRNVVIPQEPIKQLCRQYHIKRLALFGSVLREDFRPDSDVDVLVEFEEGHVPGFGFFTIQEELTKLLGRPVDLHTPGFLSPYFRQEVLEVAEVQYAGT
jgi:predicted nucleotidyltransferase